LRFPMARHGPVLNLSRTFGDIDHSRDPVLALTGLTAGLPDSPPGAQTHGQITLQRPTGLDV
ncbi:hypothetical protein J7I86_21995, partial [Arthrobacter sp. ISL-95]